MNLKKVWTYYAVAVVMLVVIGAVAAVVHDAGLIVAGIVGRIIGWTFPAMMLVSVAIWMRRAIAEFRHGYRN